MKKKEQASIEDIRIVPIGESLLSQAQTRNIEVACEALSRGDYVAIAELIACIEELRREGR